jgi:hypothetical protein
MDFFKGDHESFAFLDRELWQLGIGAALERHIFAETLYGGE